MKASVADYRYRIFCVRIVPVSGDPVYLTGHVKDVVMSGHTYQSDSGYEFTGMPAESTMSPAQIDLSGIADIAGIDYDEIVSGVYDNARVYCFATTWTSPVEDEEPLGMAFMGRTTLKDKRYISELMMSGDALNQAIGKTYGVLCPKTFGGQEYAGCTIALAPLTVTGAITSVTNNQMFRDSSRSEDDDYFAEGTIRFTTGANAGLKAQEIKIYSGVLSALITGITQAASAVVTLSSNPFSAGDPVSFSGVSGMTEINGTDGIVTSVTDTTITVNINSSGFTAYISGGTATQLAGSIVTYESFYYDVDVGDEYEIIPGCRKRLEDCRDKWDNVVNFGGFSYIPTSSQYQDRGLK